MRNLAIVLLALSVAACATAGPQPDCVLGVNPADVPQQLWDDSLDVLITHAVDQRGTWTCPPAHPIGSA